MATDFNGGVAVPNEGMATDLNGGVTGGIAEPNEGTATDFIGGVAGGVAESNEGVATYFIGGVAEPNEGIAKDGGGVEGDFEVCIVVSSPNSIASNSWLSKSTS